MVGGVLFAGMFASLVSASTEPWVTNVLEMRSKSVAGEPTTGAGYLVKTAWDQFPSRTEADRELERILQGGSIDLALVNWLVAADIPEFKDMTRDAYFKQLTEIPTLMTKAARGWNPHYDSGNNISVLFQWSFP